MSDAETLRRLAALEKALGIAKTRETPYTLSSSYTPTYTGGTLAGVTTYSQQIGEYRRVGDLIVVSGRVTWTAATGTGQARIGLPFAAANISGMQWAASLWTSGVTYGGGPPQAQVTTTTDYLALWTPTSNTTIAAVLMEAAGAIIFTVSYFVD